MRHKHCYIFAAFAAFSPMVALANGIAPFGVASAYNLFAIGSYDSHGVALLPGNISTTADVTGREAAAGMVLSGTTIGSSLNADPWGSLASFDLVSTGGLNAGETFNVNSHGNVYAPGTNGGFNFNGGGHRVTSGGSGIDFNGLRSTLDAGSLALAALATTGQVLGTNQPGVNPSFYVLRGTSTTLNVFNISAAAFADTNHPLDIQAPVGSTIVINVSGANVTLGTGIYYNQNQNSGDSAADDDILFNFATATSVAIDGQFDASILAPFALLSGTAQMGGTFIAAEIGQTGEVHNDEFTGVLPFDPGSPVPEPGTLALLGTGVLSAVKLVRRRLQAA